MYIADLHLHSKYSRATSPQSDLDGFAKWAKIKGIDLLAVPDWTQPNWRKSLKNKLKPAPGKPGVFVYKDVYFVLGTELSCIYKKGDKTRKIHLLVYVPSLHSADKISNYLDKHDFNVVSDGRPILGIDAQDLVKIILELEPKALIVPAHIWTPWFSLYGSKSGFNSLAECFGNEAKYIYAFETGLSADPLMCYGVSDLDNLTIISNSDAHSPQKLGREATFFKGKISYDNLYNALKNNKVVKTLEFYPQEGKYYFDGHRKCEICFHPKKSLKYKKICPVCKKPLTLGVMHRVLDLTDKTKAQIKQTKKNKPSFQRLVPLPEIIAQVYDMGVNTKTVNQVYDKIIKQFKNEFNVLLKKPLSDLPPNLRLAIKKVRAGKVDIAPGFDGQYGQVKIFNKQERKKLTRQKKLF